MVGDYRGVTLMPSLYKVYTSVLAERLKEEAKGKSMIPRMAGFRKGMRTIDNIYVLNYLVNRQIGRAGKKLVALFVDLKAAFDTMDKEVLVETMKRKGLRKELVRRNRESAEGDKEHGEGRKKDGGSFWMVKGLR